MKENIYNFGPFYQTVTSTERYFFIINKYIESALSLMSYEIFQIFDLGFSHIHIGLGENFRETKL
jgi:hypothetical protein